MDTLSASATRPITTHTGLKAMLKPLISLAKDDGGGGDPDGASPEGRAAGWPAALVGIPRHLLQIEGQ